MQEAGVTFEEDEVFDQQQTTPTTTQGEYSTLSTDELEAKLDEAIREEDYTRAARLRDEINKRK